MPDDFELERLIDGALPGYSLVEPRPGLEERVVARALAEKPRFPRIAWQWAFAPAFAALLVWLILPGTRQQPLEPVQAIPKSSPTVAISSPETTAAPHAVSASKKAHPHVPAAPLTADQQPLPKLQVFPSPYPLTADERAAMEFTRVRAQTPVQTTAAEVEIFPIHIAELQIMPLAPAGDASIPVFTPPMLTSQQP